MNWSGDMFPILLVMKLGQVFFSWLNRLARLATSTYSMRLNWPCFRLLCGTSGGLITRFNMFRFLLLYISTRVAANIRLKLYGSICSLSTNIYLGVLFCVCIKSAVRFAASNT